MNTSYYRTHIEKCRAYSRKWYKNHKEEYLRKAYNRRKEFYPLRAVEVDYYEIQETDIKDLINKIESEGYINGCKC